MVYSGDNKSANSRLLSDGTRYAVETDDEARGTSRLFFRCPVGGEMCGPCFTPDAETLFITVQHPGTEGTKYLEGFAPESTFKDPATRWPDFDPKMPPRPSLVVVTKKRWRKDRDLNRFHAVQCETASSQGPVNSDEALNVEKPRVYSASRHARIAVAIPRNKSA